VKTTELESVRSFVLAGPRSTRLLAAALLAVCAPASVYAATLEVVDLGISTSIGTLSEDATVVAGVAELAPGVERAWIRRSEGVHVFDWMSDPADPDTEVERIGFVRLSEDGETLAYEEIVHHWEGSRRSKVVISRDGFDEMLDRAFYSSGSPDSASWTTLRRFSPDALLGFGEAGNHFHGIVQESPFRVRHEPSTFERAPLSCPSSYISPPSAADSHSTTIVDVSRSGAVLLGQHDCILPDYSSGIDVVFLWGGPYLVYAAIPETGERFEGSADALSGDGLTALLRRASDGAQMPWRRHTPQVDELLAVASLPGVPPVSVTVTQLSDDGSVLAGTYDDGGVKAAFRWADGVFTPLGALPGGTGWSDVDRMTPDGSVISGTANAAGGNESYYWDEVGGMRTLEDAVAEQGVDLAGWDLDDIQDWSTDGRSFVGEASKDGEAVGYLVRLDVEPVPGPAHLPFGLTITASLIAGSAWRAGFGRRASCESVVRPTRW